MHQVNTQVAEAIRNGRNELDRRGYSFPRWGFGTEHSCCPEGALLMGNGVGDGDHVPPHVAEACVRVARAFARHGHRPPIRNYEFGVVSRAVPLHMRNGGLGPDTEHNSKVAILEVFNEALAAEPVAAPEVLVPA